MCLKITYKTDHYNYGGTALRYCCFWPKNTISFQKCDSKFIFEELSVIREFIYTLFFDSWSVYTLYWLILSPVIFTHASCFNSICASSADKMYKHPSWRSCWDAHDETLRYMEVWERTGATFTLFNRLVLYHFFDNRFCFKIFTVNG